MGDVILFDPRKTKRYKEEAAKGNALKLPRAFHETKALVNRQQSAPERKRADEFVKTATEQLTDDLIRSLVAKARLFTDRELEKPAHLADVHFLVNHFLTDLLQNVILPDIYKPGVAVSEEELTEAYRKKVDDFAKKLFRKGEAKKP